MCASMAMASALLAAVAGTEPDSRTDEQGRAMISVGMADGDMRGGDNRAIQAAVDYVAGLGGGTVMILPGRYIMRNALRLRDNVRVCGTPSATTLALCNAATSPLAKDGDCNQRELTLANPVGFQVGDGVAVSDRNWSGGFCVSTATITAQTAANVFRISTPLYLDYFVSKGASARQTFPAIGGWGINNAVVEDLIIEGNSAMQTWLDGCRGGGIYFFECRDVLVRRCAVRDYNGDGISFQVSERVVVEDCVVQDNRGYGLHPGSGSAAPVMRRNKSVGNGSCGMFVCWRVQRGIFDDNELCDNKGEGISIGHKDSDNVFRNNTITGNAKAGVLFRVEDVPQGADRNIFEGNRILDNGKDGAARAGVVLTGCHSGLVFRGNTIGNTRRESGAGVGMFIGKQIRELASEGNRFVEVGADVMREE